MGLKGQTMAKEYIEKEYALYVVAHFGGMLTWGKEETLGEITQKIKSEPAADVKEVVHGEWRPRGGYFRCSECDTKTLLKDVGGTGGFSHEYEQILTNFCPNCGADMRGGKDGS